MDRTELNRLASTIFDLLDGLGCSEEAILEVACLLERHVAIQRRQREEAATQEWEPPLQQPTMN